MEELKEQLVKYIEWLSEKDDVFYAFDNPTEAATEYLSQNL